MIRARLRLLMPLVTSLYEIRTVAKKSVHSRVPYVSNHYND